jgi:hypothetical protein
MLPFPRGIALFHRPPPRTDACPPGPHLIFLSHVSSSPIRFSAWPYAPPAPGAPLPRPPETPPLHRLIWPVSHLELACIASPSSPASTWAPCRCEARDGLVGAEASDWGPGRCCRCRPPGIAGPGRCFLSIFTPVCPISGLTRSPSHSSRRLSPPWNMLQRSAVGGVLCCQRRSWLLAAADGVAAIDGLVCYRERPAFCYEGRPALVRRTTGVATKGNRRCYKGRPAADWFATKGGRPCYEGRRRCYHGTAVLLPPAADVATKAHRGC